MKQDHSEPIESASARDDALISVIVPVYNVEDYIEECLDSILAQTYARLEIILVDDGSTDSSGILCDAYAARDDRIKVIHKDNGGQGSARNVGIAACQGRYIGFVDPDDRIKPEMYERLLQAVTNEDSDFSSCGFSVIDFNGVLFPRTKTSDIAEVNFTPPRKIFLGNEIFDAFIKDGVVHAAIAVWTKLFKYELFETLKFPEIRAREDRIFMQRLALRAKKAVVIDEDLYIYRQRSNSTDYSRFSPKKAAFIAYDDDLIDQLRKYGRDDIINDMRWYNMKFIMFSMLDIISSQRYFKYRSIYAELKKKLRDNLKSKRLRDCPLSATWSVLIFSAAYCPPLFFCAGGLNLLKRKRQKRQ
jgi:glycosyltransferase involved in cell wall biosynthesis